MDYLKFEIGIKVRVAESYLTDECTQHIDTTEIAYVFSEPSDSEELVGIQYENEIIDYVPQDILEILGDEKYHHCDKFAGGGGVGVKNLWVYKNQQEKPFETQNMLEQDWIDTKDVSDLSHNELEKFKKEYNKFGKVYFYEEYAKGGGVGAKPISYEEDKKTKGLFLVEFSDGENVLVDFTLSAEKVGGNEGFFIFTISQFMDEVNDQILDNLSEYFISYAKIEG